MKKEEYSNWKLSCTYKRESMLQHANHVALSLKNANPASNKVGYKQVLFISHKYNQVYYLHLHFRPPVKSPECFLTSIFYNNLEHKLTRALPFYFNIPNFEPEAFFIRCIDNMSGSNIVLESGHPTHPKKN